MSVGDSIAYALIQGRKLPPEIILRFVDEDEAAMKGWSSSLMQIPNSDKV